MESLKGSKLLIVDKISSVAKAYNVLDYTPMLRKLVGAIGQNPESLTKKDLHRTLSNFIMSNYKGEITMKALLVSVFKQKDVTAAFEIRVNNSRVDFLTINGETRSYEIKSGLDNLSKLLKQTTDYGNVFEYNYIVIDEKHYMMANNLLPEGYGITILEKGKLVNFREAKKNSNLSPEMQLKLFTQKELRDNFKNQDGSVKKILIECTPDEINESLKEMLKNRYKVNWDFLKSNLKNIFAIDYQYFFYHNISPDIIYHAS